MELSILNLFLVLLSAWIAGSIVNRLGYPAIFGEIMVGIILGPPLLGLLDTSEALAILAEVGVLLMMLYIGMEIDPKELFKASWGGFLAAIGGFITPFILAYLVVTFGFGYSTMAGLFIGIAAGVTSLATKSRILADLKLLDTRIAHVMMAGALIADSLSLVVFAGIISFVDFGTLEAGQLLLVVGKIIVFFAISFFIGIKILPISWNYLSQLGLANRTSYVTFILLVTLLFAEMAELAELHAILGAFLAGLFMREGVGVERKLTGELRELVRDVSIGFLAPIFFVTAGFHVTLDIFVESLPLLLSIIFVATIGKIVGTAVFYLFSGYGWREGIIIGAGMNGRGAVEIVISQIALDAGIISQEIFSVLVFMAIFTTATVPIFLKMGTDWLTRRGELTRSIDKRRGAVIVGAGPTSRAMAKELVKTQPVWLIDNNMDHCLQAKADGLNAFYGDVLDIENLSEVDTHEARWFLSLTSNTEVNMLAAQLARNTFNVPYVYALLTRTEKGSLREMLSDITAIPIFDGDISVTSWDRRILHDKGVTQADMDIDSPIELGDLIQKMRSEGKSIFPLTVVQNGEILPFSAVQTLNVGDKITFLQRI